MAIDPNPVGAMAVLLILGEVDVNAFQILNKE